MAERRMFTKKITDSDPFTEMPLSAQALYFHLNMNADDDGFLNNPKKIQRSIGASEDDLKLLIAKRFLLFFENGVIVVKHWRMHNLLRKDRYTETQYLEEKATLLLQKDGSYTEKPPELLVATEWQPNGNQMATQCSIGKCSVGEENTYEECVRECVGPFKNVFLSKEETADIVNTIGHAYIEYVKRLSIFIWTHKAEITDHHKTILKWYYEDQDAGGCTASRMG